MKILIENGLRDHLFSIVTLKSQIKGRIFVKQMNFNLDNFHSLSPFQDITFEEISKNVLFLLLICYLISLIGFILEYIYFLIVQQ